MTGGVLSGRVVEGIDIVVPVFGAASHLDRCLASIARHSTLPPHTLIVVADGPQEGDVEEVLSRQAGPDSIGVQVLRNDTRRGFVASVNRGMRESTRDVVLLNSDTEVTARWLDNFHTAAYSSPRIATVTPLSNSATICSLPEFLEDNLLPADTSTDCLGEIVSLASSREYPRLPTGVGVCLYIRRAAIEAVGLFDETRFGLGYGEENEFCIRATRAGFEHIVDDATFIYHAGQRSFGRDKIRHLRRAMRQLRSVDRSYVPRIAAFIDSDPLAPIRGRIVDGVLEGQGVPKGSRNPRALSILHVTHGWPPFDVGGTEQYARQLALNQVRHHNQVSALVRVAEHDRATGQRLAYLDRGVRVRLLVNNFDQRNPIARNALKNKLFERELDGFIDSTEPDLVHVHHLAGFCASLMGVIRRRNLPIVYQTQDWWAMCARANLWHADDSLCPGPSPTRCARCLPLTGLAPRGLLNNWMYRARRRYLRRQIRQADAYVMGSRAVHRWYSEAGFLDPAAAVHVLDYPVEMPGRYRDSVARRDGPLTFGFIGALMPHKGVHIAVEAFRGINPDAGRLLVWGNPEAQPDYTAKIRALADTNTVEILGKFDDRVKAEILASIDVLIVPSVGFESFGIAAREAMAAGVPVLAARRGALEELDIDGMCGATVTPEDPSALRAWIDRLIEKPETLDAWRRSLPASTTVAEHVGAIDRIYRQVVGGTG